MIELPGLSILWDALPEARMVGGAVRDVLAARDVADVDFVSPLLPDEVMARLRLAGIKTVPTGLAHGTVTALSGGRGFEITTLRRDVETDGRHAKVEFTDDWREDASRRDFTINAMSATRDGAVFDYFDGRGDLAAGRVRFVGDAARRIAEDYLRIFRFFRFFARYGKGAPDAEALAAITSLRDGVKQVSVERVWRELKLLLAAPDPTIAVRSMEATGVLSWLMPGADTGRLAALVARGAPADAMLRVAALFDGEAAAFAERFKLSGEEQHRLAVLSGPNGLAPGASDAQLRQALADEEGAILIGRTWLEADERMVWDELRRRIAGMDRPVFPLLGRDITARGIQPGPQVGKILADVRDWWMAGGCIADRDTCLERAFR